MKENDLLFDKKIAIIGAGPGGLTLARLLQLRGAEVKVYERDLSKDARVQGAIVDLHYQSGLKAIEKAGLSDAFKDSYMRGADNYRIVDKHGNIHFDDDRQKPEENFGDHNFRPEIDRGTLRDVLLNALQPDTVVWNSQFVRMEQVDNVWRMEFKNGTIAIADIVIGADGGRSKIRPYVTDIKAKYSGVTIVRGEIEHPERDCPEMNELGAGGTMGAYGDNKHLVTQPRGGGKLIMYASAQFPEGWAENCGLDFDNNGEIVSFLTELFEDWKPLFFTLFKASQKFSPQPLNYFPPDQKWRPRTNVTLIGDAAHLMPPSGEGVNMAMLDAVELSECLASGKFNNITDAFSAFEKQMLENAAGEAKDAISGITEMHAYEALEQTVQMFKQWKANA